MDEILNNIGNFFANSGANILIALSILILGGILVHFFVKCIKAILYRTPIDDSVVTYITAILKILLWLLLIFVCAGILDLSTSSLLVCLSSVALAIGLALKDSFANLTNGFFIIYNKTFKRGDHISINGIEGKVQNIKLFSIELITFDNIKLIIPNNKFTSDTVINYSAMPTRRINTTFSVAYGTNIDLVVKTIKKVLKSNELVLKNPEPDIYLSKHNSSSLDFIVKAWTETDDYWTVFNQLPKDIYNAFEKEQIEIPFNQLDIHFDDKNLITKGKNNEK